MKEIQAYFDGVGRIVIFKNYCTFRINSLSQIVDKVIPQFDSFSLITQKLVDYKLFKEIVNIMKNKEHTNLEG